MVYTAQFVRSMRKARLRFYEDGEEGGRMTGSRMDMEMYATADY